VVLGLQVGVANSFMMLVYADPNGSNVHVLAIIGHNQACILPNKLTCPT
jgi:hypothetical protein